MKISELGTEQGFRSLQSDYADRGLGGGYTSDLLSDVMANAKSEGVLVTIQAHKNTVAVASLIGIAAIVICNGRPVPDDMIEAARAEGVAVFHTDKSQFEVSGLLWPALGAGTEGAAPRA
ncbi:MAG: hypothetical protein JNG85_01770 [Spirochaetaceae bacterium]|nr:hypothetical protein [Spirochaetaceae bacterium]